MQVRGDAFVAGPVNRHFMEGLQQAAVHLRRKERGPLAAHIVVPEQAVEMVSLVPYHIAQSDAHVQAGRKDILDPFGIFRHGDQQRSVPTMPVCTLSKPNQKLLLVQRFSVRQALKSIFSLRRSIQSRVGVMRRMAFSRSSGVVMVKSGNS